MGELFDQANHRAELARINASRYEAEQEAKREAEHQISQQRADEFIELMRQYEVPQVALNEERWRKPLLGRLYRSESFSVSKRHLKLEVLAMGWVAIDSLYIPEEYYKIFVGENGEIVSCQEQTRWGLTYLMPNGNHNSFSIEADQVLTRDDAMRAMGDKLSQLGIV